MTLLLETARVLKVISVQQLTAVPTRQRLGEQVASLLLDAIRLREYLPGQRLPSEHELCARLGVNRTSVREGLRWLEYQQFIEVRRGKYGGAFVLQAPMDLALERLRGKIDDLRQLFEYRAVIEPVAAAMAAERIDDSELARVLALHKREREVDLTREQARAIDVELHEIIAAGSKNQYIFNAVHEIRLRLAAGLDVTGRSVTRRHESQTGHADLIRAIEKHDPVAAAAAMERHAAATRRSIVEALAEKGVDLEGGITQDAERSSRAPTTKWATPPTHRAG